MKQVSIFLIALSFTAMTLVAAEKERNFEQSYPVSAEARFSLSSHKGQIRVRPADINYIKVSARIHLGEDADVELLDRVKINADSGNSWVSIVVEFDQPGFSLSKLVGDNQTWPYVDFEIQVPRDSSLSLESHKGEFDVDAPSGKVEIESHKGTGSIKGVRNSFELETHKGQFDVEILDLHDVEVETHKGDISLRIHDAHDFTISGETNKGNLEVRGLDIKARKSMDDDDDEMELSHREGSGRNRIELETHKGTIRLEFIH